MSVGFRLEFYDIRNRSSIIVEVSVREPFWQYIDTIIEELYTRIQPL